MNNHLIKKVLIGGFSLLPVFCGAKAKKPNVILFFIDDFGYGDLGCYGNQLHRTPNIDALAENGLRLTDFCVGSSLSTPSRSALMTGCYPKRVSMTVNSGGPDLTAMGMQVLYPASRKGLNPSEITIAELMKEEGYSTACIGKWHLGDQPCYLPTRQGFDYYFGVPYSNDMDRKYCPLPLLEQETVIDAPVNQDSLTFRYTEKTVRFIREHKKDPFFIYLCHNMTHFPLAASPAFRGKSKDGLYGDATEELDWSMGEIVKALREEGLDENTLIILTSDNGATRRGSNGPLRGYKGDIYEGGFRVPCIMYWPGKIPAGTTSDALVTSMDLLPTLAQYCGYRIPEDRILDGHNVSRLLEGKKTDSPTGYFCYYQKHQLQAVRWGDWKYFLPLDEMLISPHKPGVKKSEARLYNLKEDLGETRNVVAEHPEVIKEMERLISRIREDLGDWKVEGKNVRPAAYLDETYPRLIQ